MAKGAYPAMTGMDAEDAYHAEAGHEEELRFEFPEGAEDDDNADIDEDEAEAILMAYQEARKSLNHRKLARGYFRKGDSSSKSSSSSNNKGKSGGKGRSSSINIEELKKKTKCRKCGRVGHWARECGQAAGGKGAMLADGESAAADAMASWTMAEQTPFPLGSYFVAPDAAEQYDAYKGCEVCFGGLSQEYQSRCMSDGDLDSVSGTDWGLYQWEACFGSRWEPVGDAFVVSNLGCCSKWQNNIHEQDWQPSMLAQTHRAGCLLGILDTGCTKSIVGADVLQVLSKHLLSHGLQVQTIQETCKFRFGADYSHISKEKVLIPCCLKGIPCTLSAFVVPGGTPLLISLGVLEALKAQINLATKTLESPVLGVSVPLRVSAGHLGIELWNDLQPYLFRRNLHPQPLSAEFAVYLQEPRHAQSIKNCGHDVSRRGHDETGAEGRSQRSSGHDVPRRPSGTVAFLGMPEVDGEGCKEGRSEGDYRINQGTGESSHRVRSSDMCRQQ
eukprot:1546757-Amphidinium_carterae.1